MIRFIIFALLLSSIISCKKYEEGPFLSLQSKKSRLSGEWYIAEHTRNGVIQSNIYTTNYSFVCAADTIEFDIQDSIFQYVMHIQEDGRFHESYMSRKDEIDSLSYDNCQVYTHISEFPFDFYGSWSFNEKKDSIELHYSYYEIKYKIIKLTDDEIKLRGTKFGSLVEKTFRKID